MATSKRKSNAGQADDRRARVAAMRAQQIAQERRSKLIRYGGFGGVGAAVVALVVILLVTQSTKSAVVGEALPAPVSPTPLTTQGPIKTIPNDSGITGVVEYDTTEGANGLTQTPSGAMSHAHVQGQVRYAVTPPVGGEHNPDWLTCGVYDKPVPNERAVHDLEHGAVWITYRAGLPAAQVTALQTFVRGQKNATYTLQGATHDLGVKYLDLSPWVDDALPAPIVISSWGAQLGVDSPTDARLQQFIDKFRVRHDKTSEAPAACGQNPSGTGGTPLFS